MENGYAKRFLFEYSLSFIFFNCGLAIDKDKYGLLTAFERLTRAIGNTDIHGVKKEVADGAPLNLDNPERTALIEFFKGCTPYMNDPEMDLPLFHLLVQMQPYITPYDLKYAAMCEPEALKNNITIPVDEIFFEYLIDHAQEIRTARYEEVFLEALMNFVLNFTLTTEGVYQAERVKRVLEKLCIKFSCNITNHLGSTIATFVLSVKYRKGMSLGAALDGFLLVLDFVDCTLPDNKEKTPLVHALEIYAASKDDVVKRELEKVIEKLLERGADPCQKVVQEKVALSTNEQLHALFDRYSLRCVMTNCAQVLSVLAVSLYDVK